jgi:hypothetical protein
MRRSYTRIAQTTVAVVGLATAVSAPPASADATLKFASDNAACIAQAWVPFNTDPEVEAGALGDFLSAYPPTNGGLRQNQEDCRP